MTTLVEWYLLLFLLFSCDFENIKTKVYNCVNIIAVKDVDESVVFPLLNTVIGSRVQPSYCIDLVTGYVQSSWSSNPPLQF